MDSQMRVVLAPIRVEREVARNVETICSLLRRALPQDLVVFPFEATGPASRLPRQQRRQARRLLLGARAAQPRLREPLLHSQREQRSAPQTLPSKVVAPSGEMLLASEPRLEQALSCMLDLSQVQPAWS